MFRPRGREVVAWDGRRGGWLYFRRPRAILQANTPGEVPRVLDEVEGRVRQTGVWAAGWVAYEAAPAFDEALTVKPDCPLPLAWFALYPPPEDLAAEWLKPEGEAAMLGWEPSIDRSTYERRLARIRRLIGAGDTYQVNYTFRLRAPFCGDPWDLFKQINAAQGAAYGFFVETPGWCLAGASPELFFRLEGDTLLARPMKGTRPRGLTLEGDRAMARDLRHSEKDRAENVMIVDMMRNDMGRIAVPGSVRVPRLFQAEPYPTLWQLTSTVTCRTRAGLGGIFAALFPCASITGAPKPRTMQIIAELEDAPRGIYTGAAGFLAPDGFAQFNVAIRTVSVDPCRAVAAFGVGGGVVWDSKEADEYQECRTKARVLTRSTPRFALLETMLWTPGGGVFLLDRHLERLGQSAEYFGFEVDLETIRDRIARTAQDLPPKPRRLRLVVGASGAVTLESHRLPIGRRPWRLWLAREPVDPADPFLYHKTTHRRVYRRMLEHCPGADDVLLWNPEGRITESCIANVMVELDGEWITPPVACGLLPGVYRQHLLEQGRLRERPVHLEEVAAAAKLMLINSVRGAWPVQLCRATDAGSEVQVLNRTLTTSPSRTS